ncbi:hypothetical protein QBZ16_000152 [Prototheca wickerhamii]|uniref:Uncharacterized protein n=1 Tax=Prototheca wickerhamii TaxID=3111 RepID=A0AAD9IKL7_PROWI|nr:hypothetical protein QBZ16_000152 [Prototheca wickerhamii]
MSVWEEAFRQALPGRGTAVGNSGRDSLQEFSLLEGRQGWLTATALAASEVDAHAFVTVAPEWLAAAHTALKSDVLDSRAWHLVAVIAKRIEPMREVGGLGKAASPPASRITQLAVFALQGSGERPNAERAAMVAILRAVASLQRARAQAAALAGALVPILLDPSTPAATATLAARTWSQIPLSLGGAEGWQRALQTLVLSTHNVLGAVFQGFEEAPHVQEAIAQARSFLDPSAPPLPGLPGQGGRKAVSMMSAPAFEGACALTARLLGAVAQQLRTAFPEPVTLPLSALAALAQRVLSLDDAAPSAGTGLVRGAALVRLALHEALQRVLAAGASASGARSEALSRSDLGGLAAERQKDVCAAALGTLRVLLISCAPAMLSAQRDRVDAMCIHLATLLVDATEADGGATLVESGAEPPVELVLAGLRALEASVTVARAHRAPYLARATDVFRRAAGLGLPIVADAAREALLSIAAVLHPRSAPLLTPEIRQLQRQAESRSEQRDIGVAAMEEQGALALPAPIFWAPAAEGPARADDDGQLGLPDSEDEGGALEPPAAAAEVPPPAPKIPELPSSLPRELPLEPDSEDESLPDIDSGASDNEA